MLPLLCYQKSLFPPSKNSVLGLKGELNKEGIQSPQPPRKISARAWCPSGIRDMLRNQRYIGKVRWNRTTKIRNPETGHRTQRRKSKAEELIVDAPEQRIVPQELWDRVRLRIAEISKRFTGRQMRGMNRTERSRTYLFSGLLVCGLCGANMVITGGTKDNAKYACPLQRYRVFVQINCSFDGTVLKTNS